MIANLGLMRQSDKLHFVSICVITFGKGGSAMYKGFWSVITLRSLAALAGMIFGLQVSAESWYSPSQRIPQSYAQLSVGIQPIDELLYEYDASGNGYVAEIEDLHYLGFMVQLPDLNDVVEYGWDIGAHIGYNSHRRLSVRLGSENSVEIDSKLWTGDFFLGSFLSIKPHPSLRLFIAGGPNIYWGRLSNDEDQHNSDGLVIDTRRSRGNIDVGLYLRTGLEYTFDNGFSVGAGVRLTNATLDFGPHGYIDMNAPHYSLLFGSRF